MYTRNAKDYATTPRAARCHYLYILFAPSISKISFFCSFLLFAYLFFVKIFVVIEVIPYDVNIICFICALSICILLICEESYLICSLCIAFASSPVPGIMELSRSMNGWISSAERSISNHCAKSSSSSSSSSITGLA